MMWLAAYSILHDINIEENRVLFLKLMGSKLPPKVKHSFKL